MGSCLRALSVLESVNQRGVRAQIRWRASNRWVLLRALSTSRERQSEGCESSSVVVQELRSYGCASVGVLRTGVLSANGCALFSVSFIALIGLALRFVVGFLMPVLLICERVLSSAMQWPRTFDLFVVDTLLLFVVLKM